MLNHEENKQQLDQFFSAIDKLVKPYFNKYFFKEKKNKSRGVIVFEKTERNEIISVDYCSYIPYGIPAFRITINSPKHFLEQIIDENGQYNEQWRYTDKNDMDKQLKYTVIKIKEKLNDLLEIVSNN